MDDIVVITESIVQHTPRMGNGLAEVHASSLAPSLILYQSASDNSPSFCK